METKSEIFKQAAATLRSQQQQIKELLEKEARDSAAEKILQRLLENGVMTSDDIFNKLSELRNKSLDDLVIMEKAAELYQGNFFSGFGKLSDETDGRGLDPLTAFLTNEGD
jgi:hypothetical protein